MSRRSSGRGYRVQPELTPFSGSVHVPSALTDIQQQYYYQGFGSSYYGLPFYQGHSGYVNGGWYQGGSITNHFPSAASSMSAHQIQGSKFSPDAPEFVPKALKHEAVSEPGLNQQTNIKPKKKKKKKKKNVADDSERPILGEPLHTKGILVDSTRTQQTQVSDTHNTKKEASTDEDLSVKLFSKGSIESQPSAPLKESGAKPQKTVKFQEPIKELGVHKKERRQQEKNPIDSSSGGATNNQTRWSGLIGGIENKSSAQPRMSFAEKLKGAPTKSPFLDWRDQRTTSSSKPAITQNAKQPVKAESTTADEPEVRTNDDGFITVTRKGKGKEKKQEIPPEVAGSQQESAAAIPKKSPEEIAKRKAEKEKKKQREKDKKRKVREDKLLAEKLAPKGQKVTLITPAVMEKFLQNKRPATKAAPAVVLADEFPALGVTKSRGNTSESESEWETTEIEVHVDAAPNPPSTAGPQRNIKRSDPIKYDLMALLAKKTNIKEKPKKSESDKKSRNRAGVVANVLDRSAPVLSRGKIRNKKPKLSEIRKALLAAKAKRKALGILMNRPPSQRPHKLHSKKFREYCDQILTDQIDQLARDMLYHLRTFQDRAFKKDPIKARMKKRLVAGLREVTKQVERKRVKIIFLAPDIQRCPETGGLDEAVQRLLDAARKHDLSIVYALSRQKMGRVLMKNVPVSCCGVLNYQATEETWKELSKAVSISRKEYQEKIKKLGLALPSQESPQLEVPTDELRVAEVKENNAETDALLNLLKLSLKD